MTRHDKAGDKPADIRGGGRRGATGSPASGKAAETAITRHARAEPALPHESDQTSGSQVVANERSAEVMRQAATDIERGLVDTDRGSATEPLKRDHFPRADESGRHAGKHNCG